MCEEGRQEARPFCRTKASSGNKLKNFFIAPNVMLDMKDLLGSVNHVSRAIKNPPKHTQ